MWILTWIHGMTNSWGLAIIGLTILVKLVMHPLTKKQMESMKRMQELQPRMKVLQDKYANDKEMMNRKVMELYKDNKVNPVAGCLPLLIQLPVFLLLFHVLTTHGFEGATFLTIHLDGSNLTTIADAIRLVDPVNQALGIEEGLYGNALYEFARIPVEELGFVVVIFSAMTNLPLLFANLGVWLPNMVLLVANSVLTWYQQRLMSSGNPQMAMMAIFMPIMMTFICLSFPGGVVLYWSVQSLMGVVSQMFVMRKTTIELQKKPVLLQEKPTNKETE